MGLGAGLWRVFVFSHFRATVPDTGSEPRGGGRKWGLSFSSFCAAPCMDLHRGTRVVNEYLVGNVDC